jgi:integrase
VQLGAFFARIVGKPLAKSGDFTEMARTVGSKTLGSRTARRSLRVFPRPVWLHLSGGRSLGYRKNSGKRGGVWCARFKSGQFRRETKLAWSDDVHDPDGVSILNYDQAVEKARTWFLEKVRESSGEAARVGPYSVHLAAEDYLKSLEDRDAPDHEGATYDFFRNILPSLGEIEVAKLTRERLNAWRAKLASRPRLSKKKYKEGEKPDPPKVMTEEEKRRRKSSTNRSIRRLVAALNYALETGKVNCNPMNWKIAPFENADVARATYLTEAEQRTFVTACAQEPDFQNLVLAALQTGCRLSELARLRVRDFVPSEQTIYVEKSKSGKPRHVFLAEEADQFFKRLTINRSPDAALLMRNDGTGWSKDAVKKPMRRSCKKAGIRRLGFHQLRHSFATRLLVAGVSMKIVAQLLGHSSVRMLEKHYGHLQDEHLQRVIAGLPRVGLNQAATVKRGNVVALPRKRGA